MNMAIQIFETGNGSMNVEMTMQAVMEILEQLASSRIEVVIDGGWGVDALLGRQTRPHIDLDIAIQHRDVPVVRALLEAHGYSDVPRDDTWECNFVLGDGLGHEIDIHSYTFDKEGQHIYGVAYPLESLLGTGTLNGQPVRCITPEWMVKFHAGYKLDENDYRDVKALCQKYGIEMPPEFTDWGFGS
jgi:lincosamide nucleotidyltransferase A/C/D/E